MYFSLNLFYLLDKGYCEIKSTWPLGPEFFQGMIELNRNMARLNECK